MTTTEIESIIQRLRDNEAIAKKFQSVESKILSVLEFRDLFEILLSEIKSTFKIPYVWITIAKNSDIALLIDSISESEIIKEYINFVDRPTFMTLISKKDSPILENKNLRPYFKLLPINKKFFIKSLAVIPISLNGEIIGSLNQADSSSLRFAPGMDTSLLKQLAMKVSLCLSNVIAHEKLKLLAYRDPHTGLLNRRVLDNVLGREFHRAKRYDKVLSIAFIDISHIKKINSTHGVTIGDAVLKFVADAMMSMTRQTDAVARYDGDKFVIILPETESVNAKYLMNRIKSHFYHNPFKEGNLEMPIHFSYGISSTMDTLTDNPNQLLRKADKNMLRKKKARKTVAISGSEENINNVISLPDLNIEKEKKPC